MSKRGWFIVVGILLLLVIGLVWLSFTTPAEAPVNSPQTPPSAQTATTSVQAVAVASSSRAVVTSPASGAKVAHTFTVSGSAPNNWYFEAVFPIQVRDSNDDLIANAQARAQSDWTKPGMIAFTANVTIDAAYSGPATLIVLKDNPSGNPENSDEVTVPIVIK